MKKLEVNKEELEKLKVALDCNLSMSLDDGDFEQFCNMAGDVLTEKEYNEEVDMVRNLIKKVQELL